MTASGVLAGVRIVEFAGIGPGPFAAMLLADMGAEIIRVDRPKTVDVYSRHVLPRSRTTIVCDLKDEAQVAEMLDLLEQADALIEGFRPGVMERLGLGPEVVLERNPRLVYGRMTGWGQEGPLAHAAGHDINYIAVAGALGAIGPKEQPLPPLNLVGDNGGGGLYLALGLLAGIIHARSGGQGQVVDAAICDGTASLMAIFYELLAQDRWQDRRAANLLDGGAPFYRTFECACGGFVSVGSLEPQFYALLCEKAGLDHPDFAKREDESLWPELSRRMEAVFKTRTRAEWCEVMEGTDVCFAPVLSLAEAPHHPHLAARGTYVQHQGVTQPAPAPRFSATPSAIRGPDPAIRDLASAKAAWSIGTRAG